MLCEVCGDREWESLITVSTIDTMPPDHVREEVYVCGVCRLALVFSCSDDDQWAEWCKTNVQWDKMQDVDNGTFSFGFARSYMEVHGIDIDVSSFE